MGISLNQFPIVFVEGIKTGKKGLELICDSVKDLGEIHARAVYEGPLQEYDFAAEADIARSALNQVRKFAERMGANYVMIENNSPKGLGLLKKYDGHAYLVQYRVA